jgi:hypothetical protein
MMPQSAQHQFEQGAATPVLPALSPLATRPDQENGVRGPFAGSDAILLSEPPVRRDELVGRHSAGLTATHECQHRAQRGQACP